MAVQALPQKITYEEWLRIQTSWWFFSAKAVGKTCKRCWRLPLERSVVEVLSPSERRQSVEEGIEDYRRIGVREFWLVSPEAETIEALRLGENGIERIGLYGRGDTVRSELLPELQIDTDRLFA